MSASPLPRGLLVLLVVTARAAHALAAEPQAAPETLAAPETQAAQTRSAPEAQAPPASASGTLPAPQAGAADPAPQPEARQQLAAEVARLRGVAAGIPPGDEVWKALRPDIERLLADADTEIAAGRLFYGTERLGDARRALMAMAYRAERPEAARDLDRFMAVWRDADAGMTADEGHLKAGGWRGTPAAIRALGESSLGQARHLYRAARDYAAADGPASGLYNLGEARAALDFAGFCRGLRFAPGAAPAAAPRSVAPELAALDAQVRAAYVPPRSIDNHADFIRIHSTLKHAAELDAAGLRYGALHTYLRARRAFAVLEAGWAGQPVPPVASLRPPLERAAAALAGRADDESIGRLFIEQAGSLVERAAAAADPAPEARSAAAILDQVMPAYLAALAPGARPEPPRADALRVTLVRWPYT